MILEEVSKLVFHMKDVMSKYRKTSPGAKLSIILCIRAWSCLRKYWAAAAFLILKSSVCCAWVFSSIKKSPNLPNYFHLITLWQKMLVAAWGQRLQVLVPVGSEVLIRMCLCELTAVVPCRRTDLLWGQVKLLRQLPVL